jgi:transposase-like protein
LTIIKKYGYLSFRKGNAMVEFKTLSTFEFVVKFPNEEAARIYFENQRWGARPICGHCGSIAVTECRDHKPMAYRCKGCRSHFSVRTGTVLAESRLPLQKWLLAIFMMTSARNAIPSTQMAHELGITQKSAWLLAQRIHQTVNKRLTYMELTNAT